MSKLDLEIGKGVGYNESNTYSVMLNIKNYDTSSVPLSAVRVSGYFWNQHRTFSSYSSAVNDNGTFSVISSAALPNYNGAGQYGIVDLNLTDITYRVDHGAIDSSTVSPVVSLIVPNGQAYIAPISISKRTDSYFEITLTELPPNTGYKVSWYIPVYDESYTTVTPVTAAPILEFSVMNQSFLRSSYRKADSKFVISWPTSTESIGLGFGLIGTSVKFWLSNGFTLFTDNQTSNWFSHPDFTDVSDTPFYVLEQFIDGSWQVVKEYNSPSEEDPNSGTAPNVDSHVTVNGSVTTSATYSVFIGENTSNPVGGADENNLFLWSNTGTGRRRSLVKFDLSAIPSSATDIDRAYLRVCVLGVSGVNNYLLNDGKISVHRMTSAWVRNEVSWADRSAGAPWGSPGGDFTSQKAKWIGFGIPDNTQQSQTANNFYADFDITDIVKYWRLHPTDNNGVIIKLDPQTHEDSTNMEKWFIGGVGTNLAGVRNASPILNIFYQSPNANGPIPQITLNTSATTAFGSLTLDATTSVAGGYVSEVQILKRDTNFSFPAEVVGSLTSTNSYNWTGSVSAVSGTHEIFVRAISDLGMLADSEMITVTFNQIPTFVYSTSGDICFTSGIDIVGRFTDSSVAATFQSLQLQDTLIPSDARISTVVQDKLYADVVWVGTLNYGLWRFDTVNNTWTKFDSSNSSLPFNGILRMDMESNGLIWMSIVDAAQNGKSIVRFNSVNWSSQNSNDWYWFNQTNSPLSAFSQYEQHVNGLDIDENNVKWFGLTWATRNNVFAVSGASFDSAHTTTYDIGYEVRSIKATSAATYIGTGSYSIGLISAGNLSTVSTTLANQRAIDVDSSGRVWVVSVVGIGNFSKDLSQVYIANPSSTPSWPNGLNAAYSPIAKKSNAYGVSIFIDSNNTKWFGFAENVNGQLKYNGGLIKYTGATFATSATSAASNWTVYDSTNTPGIPDNNVSTIIRDSSGRMYIGTWKGFCVLDGNVWRTFNDATLDYTVNSNNQEYTISWNNPSQRYGDVKTVFTIDGTTVEYPLSLNLSKVPTITRTTPAQNIISVRPGIKTYIAHYSIDGDYANGDDITAKVYSSVNNSVWNEVSATTLNYCDISDTLGETENKYFKIVATTQIGCSAESNSILVFGGSDPETTLSASSTDYAAATPLLISGTCLDFDTVYPKTLDGYTFSKTITANLSYVTSSVNFITSFEVVNGDWAYSWETPVIGTSAISATLIDSIGGTFTKKYVLSSSIKSSPIVSMLNPTSAGLIVKRRDPIVLSASAYSNSPVQTNKGISAVKFLTSVYGDQKVIGSGSYNGTNWTYSTNVSSISNLYSEEYSEYSIFASATDHNGIIDVSDISTLTINTPPVFTVTSPVGNACSISNPVLNATVTEYGVGVSATVYLLSGTNTVYTSASNNNGEFSWPIPWYGAHSVSAKVMDNDLPGDYSLTDISFNLGVIPSATGTLGYPVAYYSDNTLAEDYFIVSAGTTLVSAAFNNGTSAYYWNAVLVDGVYTKSTLITSSNNAFTNFTVGIDIPAYQPYPVIIEVYSNEHCSNTQTVVFYGIGFDADITLSNLCNSTTTINGSFKTDIYKPGTNPTISNTVSASLKANGVSAIGTPTLGWSESGYSIFAYDWNTPIEGTSAITLTVAFNASPSATFKYTKAISPLTITTAANIETGIIGETEIKPNVFTANGSGVVLSASANLSNIDTVEYLVETENSVYVAQGAANYPYTAAIQTPRGIINYRAKVTTLAGCEFFSAFTSILAKIEPTISLIPKSNGCSNSSIEFAGSVKKVGYYYNGAYDISAAGYSIKSDDGVLTVNDNFNNVIFSSATAMFGNEPEIGIYYNYSNPVVATSAFSATYDNGLFNTQYNYIIPSVRKANSVIMTSPVSGSTHNILSPITLSISSSDITNPISFVEYYVDGIVVNKQTVSGTGNYAYGWIPTNYGTKSISGKITFKNGCTGVTPTYVINVIDSSVAFIVSPLNGSSLISGTTAEIVAAVNSVTNGSVSAVTLISDLGTSASMTQRSSSLWSADIQVAPNTSAFFVRAFGTVGSFNSSTAVYNIIQPLSASVSVNSNTASVSGSFSITATSTTPNSPIVSAQLFEVVNGVYNLIGDLTSSGANFLYTLPANRLDVGVNDLVVRFTDSYNVTVEKVLSLTVVDVSINTYPNISYLSSNPETRMAQFGETIESRFLMQDNIYGIDTTTIGFNSPYATLAGINPINGSYKIEVIVNVSGTANLIVSAANNIGNYSSATVANYIFVCEGSRQINLTNYIPNTIAYDMERSSDSEFYTLTKFFETYLNTLYENLEKPCSIGILDKINKLRSLHDVDTMDIAHIQYFAKLMGYNVNVNIGEIGIFSQPASTSAFSDNENFVGQLSEYQQKALRFVIRNLPNWYSIKTTRNAIRMLLLSFGIFGDIVELYTTDYVLDWIQNIPSRNQIVDDTITPNYWPTPHMAVYLDLNTTDRSAIYGDTAMLDAMYKAIDSIRPANAVFEGLIGKMDATLPSVYVDMTVFSEETIYVPSANRLG